MQESMFRELWSKKNISHCVVAFLTTSNVKWKSTPDLLVIFENIIEIYSIELSTNHEIINFRKVNSNTLHSKIASIAILVGSQRIHPKIQDGRDTVFLSLHRAKCAVCQWERKRQHLAVSALHCWDYIIADKTKGKINTKHPMLRSDQTACCCAILFDCNKLAVMWVLQRQLNLSETLDSLKLLVCFIHLGVKCFPLSGTCETTATSKWSSCNQHITFPSYILNLGKKCVGFVLDIEFLLNYFEPVLAVLHELQATWTGCLNQRKDTCALTVIKISVETKLSTSLLWFEKLNYCL
jgi:hypothetical protein